MKILLVDNGTSFREQLQALLSSDAVTTVSFEELRKHSFDPYDLIILSGGHKFSIAGHRRKYAHEIELIRACRKPLVGICLGFELIVTAFGGSLQLLRRRVHNTITVSFVKPDAIAGAGDHFRAFESHRLGVKALSPELVSLAESKYGIEVIKHTSRPIYAFQFHPEMSADGKRLFESVIGELAV